VAALEETAAVLRRLWEAYPNVPAQEVITGQLLAPWRRLTDSHGFIFDGEDESAAD
jgi:hypothetical protein